MVNHIRTLLLNMPAASAPGSVYVPLEFTPVPVPAQLQSVRAVLLPLDQGPDAVVAAVDAIMRLCNTPELEEYLVRFDARITYTGTADAALADMCGGASASALDGVRTRIASLSPGVFTRLFAWPRYLEAMETLKLAAVNTCEGPLRIAAVAMAFAYQLERVRTGD